MPYGVTVKEDRGDTRVEIQCAHLSGLLYVVPSETSWVCQRSTSMLTPWLGFSESSWTWRTLG